MPKFRLMHGRHIQANPDGLDQLKLRDLEKRATPDMIAEAKDANSKDEYKVRLVSVIRGEQQFPPGATLSPDGGWEWQATDRMKPVFEENNPEAVRLILQDPGKYRSLEGEIDPDTLLGPITQAEIDRRGLANPSPGSTPSARSDLDQSSLERMTIAQLRQLAEAEEIDVSDCTTKAELVATISEAASV